MAPALDDLQALTGLSQKYLSRVENDRADPGWHTVLRIAHALHLDLSGLVAQGPDASPHPPS